MLLLPEFTRSRILGQRSLNAFKGIPRGSKWALGGSVSISQLRMSIGPPDRCRRVGTEEYGELWLRSENDLLIYVERVNICPHVVRKALDVVITESTIVPETVHLFDGCVGEVRLVPDACGLVGLAVAEGLPSRLHKTACEVDRRTHVVLIIISSNSKECKDRDGDRVELKVWRLSADRGRGSVQCVVEANLASLIFQVRGLRTWQRFRSAFIDAACDGSDLPPYP